MLLCCFAVMPFSCPAVMPFCPAVAVLPSCRHLVSPSPALATRRHVLPCAPPRFEARFGRPSDRDHSSGNGRSARPRRNEPSPPPRRSRDRSRSPRQHRSRSPAHRKDKAAASGSSSVFGSGASTGGFSACAVCLGRHRHSVRECRATRTWDEAHATFATRHEGKLVRRSDNSQLCFDWQRPMGCRGRSHDAVHICSGCGDAAHGANGCPRAQRA